MLVKKAKYKKVRVWQNKEISPEVHGCDNCKAVMENWPNEDNRLDMTVWHKKDDSDTRHYHFCSWDCVMYFIPKIKSDYFASLPFLKFYSNGKGSATEWKEAIKNHSSTPSRKVLNAYDKNK